jgi:hypothetical protein
LKRGRIGLLESKLEDDQKGVITAVETTPGSIAENKKLMGLIDQYQKNTRCTVRTVVADHKYGTNENYPACQLRGITAQMGEATRNATNTGRKEASSEMKLLPLIRCKISIAVQPGRYSSHAESSCSSHARIQGSP